MSGNSIETALLAEIEREELAKAQAAATTQAAMEHERLAAEARDGFLDS